MARRRLTHQQTRRIQSARENRRAEVVARHRSRDQQVNASSEQENQGLVVANHGHHLLVEANDGSLHRCVTRRNLDQPVTGDRVYWQATIADEGVIVAAEPRWSILARPDSSGKSKPLAANISLLIIVVAPAPPLNERLIDRYLVAAEAMPAKAGIVLNKIDRLQANARQSDAHRLSLYERLGYRVLSLSAHTGAGMSDLRQLLRGEVAILLGQSGVGKSSLVRALAPQAEINVGALSAITGLGTHTTTHAALYHLADGGDLIDSPGVRSFEPAIDASQVEHGFREIAAVAAQCRFADCSHQQEPDCEVLAALADGRIDKRRFQSLLQLRAALRAKRRPAEHR